MAKKQFTLNTQPHEAEIGDVTLLFKPEVLGDEFLDSYEQLQGSIKSLNINLEDLGEADLSQIRASSRIMREFLASLMVPESAETFARWDVVVGGEKVSSHGTAHAAGVAAEAVPGATVKDAGIPFPERILVQLMEWVSELYGGGRPPTSSNGSAPASPSRGTRGKAASRSKG